MSNWLQYGPDEVPRNSEGIPLEDMNTLTLEAGKEVSDLSIPEKNYIAQKAKEAERLLEDMADDVPGVTVETRKNGPTGSESLLSQSAHRRRSMYRDSMKGGQSLPAGSSKPPRTVSG